MLLFVYLLAGNAVYSAPAKQVSASLSDLSTCLHYGITF